MSKASRIVVLCEDRLQEVFVRRFLSMGEGSVLAIFGWFHIRTGPAVQLKDTCVKNTRMNLWHSVRAMPELFSSR